MKRFFIVLIVIPFFTSCQEDKYTAEASWDKEIWVIEVDYPEIIKFKYALKDYEISNASRDSLKMVEVFYNFDEEEIPVGIGSIRNDTVSGFIHQTEIEKAIKLNSYPLTADEFFDDAIYTVRLYTIPDAFSKNVIGVKSFRVKDRSN